jgi:predicted MPP superfamily phosphohydrolase
MNKPTQKITRRSFLKFLGYGLIDLVLLSMGGIVYDMVIERGSFSVETIQLKLKRLPQVFSGLRVAQISDIHMGGWMNPKRFQQVADLVISEKPDILLITGDFLLGHEFSEAAKQAILDLIPILSSLARFIPSFAVLGNHDYWTSSEAIRQMLYSCRIADLTNTVFTVTRENENLHLCGVDDIWQGDVRLDEVIAKLTDKSVAILLAHEPDFADTSAATGRFDLQISGHTHGGQVTLPLLGPPIRPYLGQKYPIGLYKIGEMFQYTNRGVGMARLPIRFNCPPEITIFVLEPSDS